MHAAIVIMPVEAAEDLGAAVVVSRGDGVGADVEGGGSAGRSTLLEHDAKVSAVVHGLVAFAPPRSVHTVYWQELSKAVPFNDVDAIADMIPMYKVLL